MFYLSYSEVSDESEEKLYVKEDIIRVLGTEKGVSRIEEKKV